MVRDTEDERMALLREDMRQSAAAADDRIDDLEIKLKTERQRREQVERAWATMLLGSKEWPTLIIGIPQSVSALVLGNVCAWGCAECVSPSIPAGVENESQNPRGRADPIVRHAAERAVLEACWAAEITSKPVLKGRSESAIIKAIIAWRDPDAAETLGELARREAAK